MNVDRSFWDYVAWLVAEHDLIIDRPQGFPHPDDPDRLYPVSYGYLKGTAAGDGEGVDVWVGSHDQADVVGVIATVDVAKHNAELKILLACTDEEIHSIIDFLNHGDMRCWLVRRFD